MNRVYFILSKGWILLEPNQISIHQTRVFSEKFRNYGGLIRYTKRNKVKINTISPYDFDLIVKVCNEMNLQPIFSDIILRLLSTINKPKVDFNTNLVCWTKNKDLQLRNYQVDGMKYILKTRSMILADSVGVGKTNQCLATMCYCYENYNYEKYLYIVPSKLKEQWKFEILKFTTIPEDFINIFDSPVKLKGEEKEQYRIDQINSSPILIISYNMVTKYKKYLCKQKYQFITIDEASKIKNPAVNQTKSIVEIAKSMPNYAIKIFVTGTPIENKLEDIYSIFNIIDKRIFGYSSEFKFNYCKTDLYGNVIKYYNLKRFKKKISKFYLRRTSDLVWKERPPINYKHVVCEMVGGQKKIYKDCVKGVLDSLSDLGRQRQINNAAIAPLINILLSCTGTCKSIDENYVGDDHSCKIAELIDLITKLSDEDKVIIFSRYAYKVNPYLINDLNKLIDYKIYSISGKDSNSDKIVNDFKNNKSILVVSDSMSYGVNMQFANYLINFDLPWNPAVLRQRIGRVYRLGQKRGVTIVNLVTKDTFDELVYKKLYDKQILSDKIFDRDEGSFDVSYTIDEIKYNLIKKGV